MSLKNLTVAKATIKTPGGDFTVRGLSLDQVTILFSRRRPVMEDLFQRMKDGNVQGISMDDARDMGTSLLAYAPDLAAEIIMLASGDDDAESFDVAKSLPMPVQVEALEQIGRLTFATEGGVKKFLAQMIELMRSATDTLSSLQT